MPKKLITFITASAILFGFFGTLYSQTWDPLWNPFRLEPSLVLEKMEAELKEKQAFHSIVDLNFLTKLEESEFQISGSLEGDIDNANSKSAINFDLLIFSSDEKELLWAGEIINIGETAYFKFKTLPSIPYLGDFLEKLGLDLENQWIKINQDLFKKFVEETGNQYSGEETKEKLMALLPIFEVKEELPDQEIAGRKTYHYLLSLNKESLKDILLSLYVPDQETLEEINKLLEKSGDIEAEIWIGKKDKLPYRIEFDESTEISDLFPEKQGRVALKLIIEMSDFDKQFEIKAPEDYKTLEEILFENL